MQNKPNLLNTQMSVTSAITMNYEQLTMNYANKNKPNSKPIKANTNPKQTQFPKGYNWCKVCIYKGLWRKMRIGAMKKQSQNKPNQTQPVVSLPVVSLPALSLVEVSNQSKGSNLFQKGHLCWYQGRKEWKWGKWSNLNKKLKKLKNSCRKCLQESFPGFIIVVVVKALVLFFFNILVSVSQLWFS